MEVREMQKTIGRWAEETFDHTEQGIAIHLLAEAVELCMALNVGYGPISNVVYDTFKSKKGKPLDVPEEEADVNILLLTLANFRGDNLEDVTWEKMDENYSRDWSRRQNPARFLPKANGAREGVR